MSDVTVNITGRVFRPGQSRPIDANLMISGGAAEIIGSDGESIAHCLSSDIAFQAQIGRAPRRATLPDGTLFETDDHDAVNSFVGPNTGGFLHSLEAFRPRLILVFIGCIAAIWGIWRYGLDIIAAIGVFMTPAPVVDAIDQGALQSIDYALAAPTKLSDAEQQNTQEIFNTILEELSPEERSKFDFNLQFREMPGLGPNALALPNGTIVITDELINLFPSEDIRAGVIGHEIGHVIEQHGLHQLYRSIGIAVLIALLAGDTGAIVEDVVLEGSVLLSFSFSRRSEREADAFGVMISQKAGYDPEGLIEFFDYIKAEFGDDSSWLSTHPSSSERMEEIRRMIDQ